MLLKAAIDRFMEGYFSTCRRSEKTKKAYRIDLDQFRRFAAKTEQLQTVSPELLEQWADSLQGKDYAPASIRRKFASLKVFFGYWVRKGNIESSPLWRIRLDLERGLELPKCLDISDLRSMLDQARLEVEKASDSGSAARLSPRFLALRNRAIIEILFATGIRVGELVALNLEDIQAEKNTFLVRGKGGRQRLAMLVDPRSCAAFQQYLQIRLQVTAEFPSLMLNVARDRLSTQGVALAIKKLACTAGVSRRVTPHMFRHSIATLLLDGGADLRLVQEFLGHQSITVTQRYTHISSERMASKLARYHPNVGALAGQLT